METFISFIPILAFSLIGSALFFTKKINFNNEVALLILALIAHITLSILNGYWIFTIGQVIVATLVFFLLVFVLGNKTSGETILTMTGLLALTPLPTGFIPLIAVFVITFIIGIVGLKKQSDSIKHVITDAVFSTGMGQSLPNYDHLPERSEVKGKRKISLLPVIGIVMTLSAVYYLIQPLFLES